MRKARQMATCLALPALALGRRGMWWRRRRRSSTGSSGTKQANVNCAAQIGVMAPITGQVAQIGGEQLNFAKLAVEQDNAKNKTKISVVEGDTQLQPAQATTVARQFVANDKIVALVGPAGSQEVSAIGSQITRAEFAAVAGSATATDLTEKGSFPTFFRVVPRDDVQGPQDAHYIVDHSAQGRDARRRPDLLLHRAGDPWTRCSRRPASGRPRVRRPEADRLLVARRARSPPTRTSCSCPGRWRRTRSSSARMSRSRASRPSSSAPTASSRPTTSRSTGSYVSSFAPDITGDPGDEEIVKVATEEVRLSSGPSARAPTLRRTSSRGDRGRLRGGRDAVAREVLEQIKKTDLPESILGQPIKFDRERRPDRREVLPVQAQGEDRQVRAGADDPSTGRRAAPPEDPR